MAHIWLGPKSQLGIFMQKSNSLRLSTFSQINHYNTVFNSTLLLARNMPKTVRIIQALSKQVWTEFNNKSYSPDSDIKWSHLSFKMCLHVFFKLTHRVI
jgi:hypothetical protein